MLLILVVLVFAALAVGPHLFGYRTMTMLSGSMAPGINPGDVTVAVQQPTSKLRTGQVISYRIPVDDHRVVSHRVVEVTPSTGGALVIRTKGDRNSAADPWTAVVQDPHVWTVRAVVPHLGSVIRVLRGPGLHVAFLYVGPALLALMVLAQIWRRPPAEPEGVLDTTVADALAQDLGSHGLAQFLTTWTGMLDARVDTMSAALTEGDLVTALDRALSLRSSSAMIGLPRLSTLSAEVECHLLAGDIRASRQAFTGIPPHARTAGAAVSRYAASLR